MFSRAPHGFARRAAVFLVAGSIAVGGAAYAANRSQAGPQPDGSGVTPLGQVVRPAGHQTALGDLPLGSALSPDGSTMLVSNDGQGTQSLQVVDIASSRVLQTIAYTRPHGLFVGLAFSPDGSKAYASGGGEQRIHVYDVAGQTLTEATPIALPTTNPAGEKVNLFPAGLAVTPRRQAAGGRRPPG